MRVFRGKPVKGFAEFVGEGNYPFFVALAGNGQKQVIKINFGALEVNGLVNAQAGIQERENQRVKPRLVKPFGLKAEQSADLRVAENGQLALFFFEPVDVEWKFRPLEVGVGDADAVVAGNGLQSRLPHTNDKVF